MSLTDQLPRLSAYDPGAVGEGGLDPLGLSATADRIADVMAPGVRARMSQPRFVTLSAVGAIANQAIRDLRTSDSLTTVDIAFEWLVVEAMVRYPEARRAEGVPGNLKAQRARRGGARLSRTNYLNGPRVFGFTGVYRPFSLDSDVLTPDGGPGDAADELVAGWERDFVLEGFTAGIAGSSGGRFRADIADACKKSLERGECAAPPSGQLLGDIADRLAPREARSREKALLRKLITTGEHEIRNEITERLLVSMPEDRITQLDLATLLLAGASRQTQTALQAAIDYENVATTLDNAFRRFLNYASQQNGAVISRGEALKTPGLAPAAPRLSDLVKRAVDSVSLLGDDYALETEDHLRLFGRRLTPDEFFDALLQRHAEVQARKVKLPWIDELAGEWGVRTPYRNPMVELDDSVWAHPMRLTTLATFLRETA